MKEKATKEAKRILEEVSKSFAASSSLLSDNDFIDLLSQEIVEAWTKGEEGRLAVFCNDSDVHFLGIQEKIIPNGNGAYIGIKVEKEVVENKSSLSNQSISMLDELVKMKNLEMVSEELAKYKNLELMDKKAKLINKMLAE